MGERQAQQAQSQSEESAQIPAQPPTQAPTQKSKRPLLLGKISRKKLILISFLFALASVGAYGVWAYQSGNFPFQKEEQSLPSPPPPSPSAAPVISSVEAKNITGKGATVTWTTNSPATSQVEYGATPEYGSQTTETTTFTKTHSAALTKLTQTTTYHYRVKSRSEGGVLATSNDYTFKTLISLPFKGKVLFIKDNSIWILDPTGERQLTTQKDIWRASTFDWLDNEIVFSVREVDATALGKTPSSIWTMNEDGTNQTQIAYLDDCQRNDLVYSPDGKKIGLVAPMTGGCDLLYIDKASGSVVELAPYGVRGSVGASFEDCSTVFWSPDSNKIYYLARGSEDDLDDPQCTDCVNGIYSVSTTTNKESVVLQGNFYSFGVSRDGTKLAYHRKDNNALYVSEINGSNVRLIKTFKDEGYASSYRVVWGPKNSRLALVKAGSESARIFIFDVGLKKLIAEYPRDDSDGVLLGNQCQVVGFSWTGENDKILIWSSCLGYAQGIVSFADLDTKKVKRIISSANRPVWVPD